MESNPREMPGARRDDESGKYTDKYPPEDFLDALEAEGGQAGTMDIAERVAPEYDRDPELFYDTTYKKLRRLRQEARLDSKEVGNSILWIMPDESPEDFLDAIRAQGGRATTETVTRRVASQYDRDPEEYQDTVYEKLRRLESIDHVYADDPPGDETPPGDVTWILPEN